MIEAKILHNVLRAIRDKTGKENDHAPDEFYLKSLSEIGMIKLGWENELTPFGHHILKLLIASL